MHTDSQFIILFLRFLYNIYQIFLVRLVVTTKKTSVNKHPIRLSPGFAFMYTKFKRQYLNSQFWICEKIAKKKDKKVTTDFTLYMFSYLCYKHYKIFSY